MTIAVLSALLIHIIWLARAYKNTNVRIMARVRAGAAISSWIITTALFCLIQATLPKIYFSTDSGGRQVVRVISSPDNSIRYAESTNLDQSGK